jgi:hypothetical protein
MAVTVAPLTTVVMNSVDEARVGTASGINNAAARVAGVPAIAILGIVMVTIFDSHLSRALNHLALPPAVLQQIQKEGNKLAGLQVPAGVDLQTRTAIQEFVKQAFVSGFRVVMLICASLSLASAVVAWMMIRQDVKSRLPA